MIYINPKQNEAKNNMVSISIVVNKPGLGRKEKSLKIKCSKEEYEAAFVRGVQRVQDNSIAYKTYIAQKKKALIWNNEQEVKGKEPTADEVIDYLSGKIKTEQEYSLQDLWLDFDKYILTPKLKNKEIEFGTHQKYFRMYKRVAEVLGKDTPLIKIGYIQCLVLVNRLREIFNNNTLYKNISMFKAMLAFARDAEKISKDPFYKIKIHKEPTEIRVFSPEDYKKLVEYKPANKREEKVQDFFIFASNTGLAYVDASELKKEDIKYDSKYKFYYIEKNRHKTNTKFFSIILDDGVKILKKYNFEPHSFINSNQKLNSYCKDIATKAGFENPEDLTCHKCRHYYITTLTRNNIPTQMVQKAAGHKSAQMTALYTHLTAQDVGKTIKDKLHLQEK